MSNLRTLAGISLCSATLAFTGLAASAGISHITAGSRVMPPMMVPASVGVKHYMHTRQTQPVIPNACCLLSYGGGAVLNTPHMYVTFWGFGVATDPDAIGKLVTNYAKHIGGSGINNVATQYYSTAGGSITNPSKEGSVWYDDVNTAPLHATDSQIRTEAGLAVQHFGYDPNGAYIIVSGYHHDPQGFLSSGWCAYHGAASTSQGVISYTNQPYMPDGGGSCGANSIGAPSDESGTDEGMTIVLGHEFTESVTDPHPFSGWNSSHGEIGDLCAWQNIQNDPMGKKSYTSQPEYSNATQSCVHSY